MNTAERAEILDRLATGQISAAEALRLLEGQAQPQPVETLKAEARAAADEIPIEELKAEQPKVEVLKVDLAEESAGYKKATNGDVAVADGKPRWLKIRVRDRASGNNKVSVTLPIGLVSFGLGIARHFGADMGGMGTDELLSVLKTEQRGTLVEVMDEEDDEQVLIYVE
ncbi:MAG: hypothetical protein IPH95_04320 [Candidatus Promineofilum sp.]|jgi:hypothetical protein|nr:hypothetical protein [Promineifilum sp.]